MLVNYNNYNVYVSILDNSEIFTSIFSTDSYFAPNGFCWDYLQCNSDAINDDPESFDYNLDKKVFPSTTLAPDSIQFTSIIKENGLLYSLILGRGFFRIHRQLFQVL